MNYLYASSISVLRNSKMKIIPLLHQTIKYYSKEQNSVLLLGEGDFNYAHSIRQEEDPTKMIATCLDSEAEVKRIFPKASMHIKRLQKAGATCHFGVDVHHLLSKVGSEKKYNMIIFNFPEAIQPAEKDAKQQVAAEEETARINSNKLLIHGILDNSKQLLKPKGLIRLIIQDSQEWGIKDIVKQCGLKVNKDYGFSQRMFQGYTPLKGAGMNPEEPLDFGNSTVYEIVRPEDFNVVDSGIDENPGKKSTGRGDKPLASKPAKKKKGKSSKGKPSSSKPKNWCSYVESLPFSELAARAATRKARQAAKTSSYVECLPVSEISATGKARQAAKMHVVLPPEVAKLVPKIHRLSESEWRAIGVWQSRGWVHCAIMPHIMLFTKPLNYQQN